MCDEMKQNKIKNNLGQQYRKTSYDIAFCFIAVHVNPCDKMNKISASRPSPVVLVCLLYIFILYHRTCTRALTKAILKSLRYHRVKKERYKLAEKLYFIAGVLAQCNKKEIRCFTLQCRCFSLFLLDFIARVRALLLAVESLLCNASPSCFSDDVPLSPVELSPESCNITLTNSVPYVRQLDANNIYSMQ